MSPSDHVNLPKQTFENSEYGGNYEKSQSVNSSINQPIMQSSPDSSSQGRRFKRRECDPFDWNKRHGTIQANANDPTTARTEAKCNYPLQWIL
jgi:hypothetical protein